MAEPSKKKRKAEEDKEEEEEVEELADYHALWIKTMTERHAKQTIEIVERLIYCFKDCVKQGSLPQSGIYKDIIRRRDEVGVCPRLPDLDDIAWSLTVWCRAHNLWCDVREREREWIVRPHSMPDDWDEETQGDYDWKATADFEWPKCKIVRAWLEAFMKKEKEEEKMT
jgi:hypothetical protein